MKLKLYILLIILISGLSVSGQVKKTVAKPTPKPTPVSEAKPTQKVTVELVNGDSMTGWFVGGDTKSITLQVASSKVEIALNEIAVLHFGDKPQTVKTETQNTAPIKSPDVQAAQETSLTFEAALIYNYGGAQPVARADFLLLDKSLNDILSEAGLRSEKNISLISTFALAIKYPSQYANFSQVAAEALKPHIIATTKSDFQGKGEFTNVKEGNYWILCYVGTRKGFAVWDLPVTIKTGKNHAVLDQNNAATAF